MKNKGIILGYRLEVKPAGERFYTESYGFFDTKEQAESHLRDCLLLSTGDKARIKILKAI